jgi:hypothetical protein
VPKKGILPTLKSYAYARLRPLAKRGPQILSAQHEGGSGGPILAVCDPMTWQNLSGSSAAVSVAPNNWRKAFGNGQKYKFFFARPLGQGWRASRGGAKFIKTGAFFTKTGASC